MFTESARSYLLALTLILTIIIVNQTNCVGVNEFIRNLLQEINIFTRDSVLISQSY